MNRCRDCAYWIPIPPWQGNCQLYPSPKPQWSETASPSTKGCRSFTPRYQPATCVRVPAREDKAG
jgi:hypothetical protein